MAIITLVCETCGGSVSVDDTHESGVCVNCKNKVLIKSDTIVNKITQNIEKHVYGHQGKDIEELVADGKRLMELDDDMRANAKFRQAITIDPKCWEAWLGFAMTGGDNSDYLSCVPAYRSAYSAATTDAQKLTTFSNLTKHLPDRSLGTALVNTYKAAQPNRKNEIFNLVSGVIGCDESEIARLVIDLCPSDWRALLAQAKIRQIRVKWCQMESKFLKKQLPVHAAEVLDIFLKAYHYAKYESEESRNTVLSYIATMAQDNSYAVFTRELYAQITKMDQTPQQPQQQYPQPQYPQQQWQQPQYPGQQQYQQPQYPQQQYQQPQYPQQQWQQQQPQYPGQQYPGQPPYQPPRQ